MLTELPLNHWGWIDSSAGGSVCIRAPPEAPLVNSPAAHGQESPSAAAVHQRTGLAMIVVISEPFSQAFAAATILKFLSVIVTGLTASGYSWQDGYVHPSRIRRGAQ
jgi:hypothetical protein